MEISLTIKVLHQKKKKKKKKEKEVKRKKVGWLDFMAYQPLNVI